MTEQEGVMANVLVAQGAALSHSTQPSDGEATCSSLSSQMP